MRDHISKNGMTLTAPEPRIVNYVKHKWFEHSLYNRKIRVCLILGGKLTQQFRYHSHGQKHKTFRCGRRVRQIQSKPLSMISFKLTAVSLSPLAKGNIRHEQFFLSMPPPPPLNKNRAKNGKELFPDCLETYIFNSSCKGDPNTDRKNIFMWSPKTWPENGLMRTNFFFLATSHRRGCCRSLRSGRFG